MCIPNPKYTLDVNPCLYFWQTYKVLHPWAYKIIATCMSARYFGLIMPASVKQVKMCHR